MVKNVQNWSSLVTFGHKLAKNCQIWSKIVKFSQNWSNLVWGSNIWL